MASTYSSRMGSSLLVSATIGCVLAGRGAEVAGAAVHIIVEDQMREHTDSNNIEHENTLSSTAHIKRNSSHSHSLTGHVRPPRLTDETGLFIPCCPLTKPSIDTEGLTPAITGTGALLPRERSPPSHVINVQVDM